MNDPGGASTLTGVCQSRRLCGLVRPGPKPGFGSAAITHKNLKTKSVNVNALSY